MLLLGINSSPVYNYKELISFLQFIVLRLHVLALYEIIFIIVCIEKDLAEYYTHSYKILEQ